jgi:hypothetical protein
MTAPVIAPTGVFALFPDGGYKYMVYEHNREMHTK